MKGDELFQNVLKALDRGDFSRLETMLGGPAGFDRQIVKLFENGKFDTEPEMLAEALSCACMLGRTATARYLIEHGVDPYAGMKTWLAGPHYAVSSGRLDTVQMLLEKKIPLEVENKYGGTLLGQALWSAVNEHKESHADIIAVLIGAGAKIEPGTLEWWELQDVPSAETKKLVFDALQS
ncbi:MAG: ankyrin repeat domain-containing protein [Pyrinomonadaceae bacterium]